MGTSLVLWATLALNLAFSLQANAEPRAVNSLVAAAVVSGQSTSYTRSQFEKVLGRQATPEDKTLALAGFVLASRLDHLLIAADKFESVPSYRLNHALKALIAANRLHPRENDADVYARLLDVWKKSCAPRIATGRACDFVFRFDKSDWERGQPDFSVRVSSKDLSHVTREFVSSYYRPSIHDMAQKTFKTGRDSVRVAGENYTLQKKPGETLTSLITRSTELWKQIYLNLNFFFVSEENARLYFSNSEPVVFRRFQVAREIREHEWDGFAFRLSQAPERYEDFIEELRKHLDVIYLRRTRKTQFDLQVASRTNLAMTLVSPHELQVHSNLYPARVRKGRFAILSLPLDHNANEAQVTAAARYVVANLSEANAAQAATLFAQITELVAQRFGLVAQREEIEFESHASNAIAPPSDARDLQMHQLLFPDASKTSSPTGLHYFVDQARARLSFIVALNLGAEWNTPLDPLRDPKVDTAKLESEILQTRLSLIYRELVLKALSEASVRPLDSEYLQNARLSSTDERLSREELKRVVLLSVDALEKEQPGSGWSRFMEQVYTAPLKPRDLQAPPASSKPRRGLSRILGR